MKQMGPLRAGIFRDNPIFVIMLGLCSPLAITTQVINGIGMGVAILIVLVGSNMVVSFTRNVVPYNVRNPVYIVIISFFVTFVDLVFQAWVPVMSEALGIFIPLIVTNCIVLGRAEAYASKQPLWPSTLDAIGMSIGYMISLVAIALVREVLGNGTITLELLGLGTTFHLSFFEEYKAVIMILPPGGFLVMGLMMGFIALIRKKKSGGTNAHTMTDAHIAVRRRQVCGGLVARRVKA